MEHVHLCRELSDVCNFDSIVFDPRVCRESSTPITMLTQTLMATLRFTPDELQQAKQLIQQMRQLRIARCNHQPDLPIALAHPEKRKLLVLAQASEDPAIGSLEEQQQLFAPALVTRVIEKMAMP